MILVTGGFGFIGSHVVRALHDRGAASVVLQRSRSEVPAHLADVDPVVVQGDVADLATLHAIGEQHEVTGILHLTHYPLLAGPEGLRVGTGPTEEWMRGVLNVARVASEWGVRRVGLASTLGVYGGLQVRGSLSEELPIFLPSPHPIPRTKKIGELLADQLAEATGVDIVNLRISGVWGPLGHDDPFVAAPALIHAAVDGAPLGRPAFAGEGFDLTYVKDVARAIALVQLADRTRYSTYNIASGTTTDNAEIVDAIRSVIPDARIDLLPGGSAWNPLDITRLQADTGFRPEFGAAAAAADYIAWLRAGNAR